MQLASIFSNTLCSASIIRHSRRFAFQQRWMHITTSCQHSVRVTVSEDKKNLKLFCEGEHERRFHGLWLRHNCRCSDCTLPHANQTAVSAEHLIRDIRLKSALLKGDQVNVEWSVSESTVHTGSFPLDWLKDNSYSSPVTHEKKRPLVADSLPFSDYKEMSSDEGLYQWLLQLNHYGVSILKNVPARHDEILKVAEKVGHLQKNIYGNTADVIVKDNATSQAYSPDELLLHMDLGYYESTPGLLLLHCVEFDECVEGGESVLLDAYPVVEEMRRTHPKQFDTLTKVPVCFYRQHYTDEMAVDYLYEKRTITVNREKEIVGINWHPYYLAPLHLNEDDELEEFYDAYALLSKLFNDSNLKLFYRLQPGEAVTLNNRRFLHSRTSINLYGGKRFLQAAYVTLDDFRSRFLTLRKRLGKHDLPKIVLNSSSRQ